MKKLLKLIIFVVLIIAFIYFGTKEYDNVKNKNLNEKNASSILLNGKYVFTDINHSKVLNRLTSKNDSIIFVCVDGNALCTKYGYTVIGGANKLLKNFVKRSRSLSIRRSRSTILRIILNRSCSRC